VKDKIIQCVSENTQFSYQQCIATYNQLKSYDLLIAVLAVASAMYMSPEILAAIVKSNSKEYNEAGVISKERFEQIFYHKGE